MLNSNIQNIAKLNLDTKCCLELNVRLTNDRIPGRFDEYYSSVVFVCFLSFIGQWHLTPNKTHCYGIFVSERICARCSQFKISNIFSNIFESSIELF